MSIRRSALQKFQYQYEYFRDLIRERGLNTALNEAVYFNRKMVLVERNLLAPLPTSRRDFDLKVLCFHRNDLSEIAKYKFANGIRKLKSIAYLTEGFSLFAAVIMDKNIVAEQWWTNLSDVRRGTKHPDLIWTGFQLKEDEVYAFDLFVAPEYRGTPATHKFASTYITELRKMGYSKLLGTFFADNIPSAMFHRMFAFAEIGTVKRHRFFFLEIKNGKLRFA